MSTQSVTGAAAYLNISQPSVSRLLRELEEAFGCPLFERTGKGVSPTPEARFFLDEIEKRDAALSALGDAAAEIRERRRGVLSIGSIAAFSFQVLPMALARAGVGVRDISLNWVTRSSRQIIERVRTGHLDLGLVYAEGAVSGVETAHRGGTPHFCLLPKSHALASQAELRLADLESERLIALAGGIAEQLDARHLRSRESSRLVVENSYSAAALAKQSGCLAIVDPFTARAFALEDDYRALPVRDLAPYRFELIRPIDRRSSKLCEQLAAEIIAVIAETSAPA